MNRRGFMVMAAAIATAASLPFPLTGPGDGPDEYTYLFFMEIQDGQWDMFTMSGSYDFCQDELNRVSSSEGETASHTILPGKLSFTEIRALRIAAALG